jgi:hypothetical protein
MAQNNLTITLNKKELAAVNHWLSQMSDVDQKNTVQNALKSGAQIIQNAGRANFDARNKSVTGNLKRSFALKVNKKKAYALSGFKRPGGAHAHLIDRGTKKRYTKNGYYRGSVSKDAPNKGSMFWTDAVESKGPEALNRIMDAVYKSLQEITNRNN